MAQSAQTLRQRVRLAYSSDETAAIEKAMAHRNELMRICRFAFRKKKDLQETLTKLQEGTGRARIAPSESTRGLSSGLVHPFVDAHRFATGVERQLDLLY